MIHRFAIFVLLNVIIGVFAPTSLGDSVDVSIEAAHSSVLLEDPLFLSVVIKNPHDKAVPFDQHLGTVHGTLVFEFRRLDEEPYARVTTVFQGTQHATSLWRSLPPRSKYVSHEMLWTNGVKPLFRKPGKYALRVRLTDVNGITGVSEPIILTVGDRSQQERELISENRRRLLRVLTNRGLGIPKGRSAEYESLKNQLNQSVLKSTLSWLILVAKIGEAENGEQFMKAKLDFARARTDMPPVVMNRATLKLAQLYIELGLLDNAQDELALIKNYGSLIHSVESTLAHRLHRQNKRKVEVQ